MLLCGFFLIIACSICRRLRKLPRGPAKEVKRSVGKVAALREAVPGAQWVSGGHSIFQLSSLWLRCCCLLALC